VFSYFIPYFKYIFYKLEIFFIPSMRPLSIREAPQPDGMAALPPSLLKPYKLTSATHWQNYHRPNSLAHAGTQQAHQKTKWGNK